MGRRQASLGTPVPRTPTEIDVAMTLPCLMLVTLVPGAMISVLNHLCYYHYIYVLDPILQVIVTYYVL